jgi:hypothetical protein
MFIRFREERGIAMVMALLVTFVVLLLGTTVLAMAVHNSEQSGMDRKRVQSVSAAEAGLNKAYSYITSPPGGISAMSNTLSGTVGSGPGGSSYAVTLTYYLTSDAGPGSQITPPFSSSYYPRSALIESVGASNGKTPRTMETFVQLTPVIGGFDGAILSNSSTTFTNAFTVNGYQGNDGNVYILNGDFSAPSGLENIKGNIYVPGGTAYVATSVHIYGQVWANGSVTLDHSQALVDQDVKSSASSVSILKGAASGKGYYCTTVTGASAIAGGTQHTCTLGAPPSQPFPLIKYVASDWASSDPPYTNFQTFTGASACTSARDYIQNTGGYAGSGFSGRNVGATVVYINATCPLVMTNNATIQLNGNLAIITRGGVDFSQRSMWNGVSGTRYMHVISAYPDAGSPSCPTQDVHFGNNTGFDTHVSAIVYSPCTVTMENNNTAFQGQVIGQNVIIGNNFNMTFFPVKVPGLNPIGFDQDIAYIREVTN